jgi:hypothetical protein
MTFRCFMARSAEKSVTGAGAGTTVGGTRLLSATIAMNKIKSNVSKASLKEIDEAYGFIGTPNPPVPTSPVKSSAAFNRAVAHLQAHAARNSRLTTSYRQGRRHCQPNRKGEQLHWDWA